MTAAPQVSAPADDGVDPLIVSGMRYGGLVRIDDPVLADRYNRVLAEFGFDPVASVPFHVDISGFSLEVASALGRMDYLDENGSNRRFVILTRRQADAPLVHATFSCEKAMLKHFYASNEGAIARITLRSALYGEIENYAYRFADVRDVLRLKDVHFECQALDGFFEKQDELRGLVGRFREDPSAWYDVALVDRMTALAGEVGDVRGVDTSIRRDTIPWPSSFTTTLFGGATFLDVGEGSGTVIGDPAVVREIPGYLVLDRSRAGSVISSLERGDHLDPLDPAWLKESGLLDHRIHMAAARVLLSGVPALPASSLATPSAIDVAINRHIVLLDEDPLFSFLKEARSLIAHRDGSFGEFERRARPWLRMAIRRARPGDSTAPEINRILARICSFDPVTLFALDKPEFYRIWSAASDAEKIFMKNVVENRYMPDKTNPRKKYDLKNRYFGDGWKD